jgi:NADPH:quinone reductase-like Zn-dependent oxidoreductase
MRAARSARRCAGACEWHACCLPVRADDPACPSPLPQPGDCVILNAATSSVGQCLVQLCKLLRLRAVAVVSGGCARASVSCPRLGASERGIGRVLWVHACRSRQS